MADAYEVLTAVFAAVNAAEGLGRDDWTVVKEIDDETLASGAPEGPTIYLDWDEENEGEYADPDVPALGLSALLIVPYEEGQYATARQTLAAGMALLRALLNSGLGLPPQPRVAAKYDRGRVAGVRCATASVAIDYETT